MTILQLASEINIGAYTLINFLKNYMFLDKVNVQSLLSQKEIEAIKEHFKEKIENNIKVRRPVVVNSPEIEKLWEDFSPLEDRADLKFDREIEIIEKEIELSILQVEYEIEVEKYEERMARRSKRFENIDDEAQIMRALANGNGDLCGF